jgi:hypothetical protein
MIKLNFSCEYLSASTPSTGMWVKSLWKVKAIVGAPTVDKTHPPLSTFCSTPLPPWTTAPVKGLMEHPRNPQPYCYCWFPHTSLKSSFLSRSCSTEVTR